MKFAPKPSTAPTVPAPAPLTEAELALYRRFKAMADAEKQPVKIERLERVQPPPPSEKTIRMHQLFKVMEKDRPPQIEAARAWREIQTDGLWADEFQSFKSCCGSRLMQTGWVEELIASIPIYEALPPASQALVRSNDELVELGHFKKADRVQILNRAAARRLTDGGQLATRIGDAAKALGLKPEVSK